MNKYPTTKKVNDFLSLFKDIPIPLIFDFSGLTHNFIRVYFDTSTSIIIYLSNSRITLDEYSKTKLLEQNIKESVFINLAWHIRQFMTNSSFNKRDQNLLMHNAFSKDVAGTFLIFKDNTWSLLDLTND